MYIDLKSATGLERTGRRAPILLQILPTPTTPTRSTSAWLLGRH
jgi:hypothetical protein